ncbi:MAG: hypothetical protein OIF38_14180 [Cellvibrionaceae bacterium]|nr:hypothetical protein [Cellvibrionaceae bacterium]
MGYERFLYGKNITFDDILGAKSADIIDLARNQGASEKLLEYMDLRFDHHINDQYNLEHKVFPYYYDLISKGTLLETHDPAVIGESEEFNQELEYLRERYKAEMKRFNELMELRCWLSLR